MSRSQLFLLLSKILFFCVISPSVFYNVLTQRRNQIFMASLSVLPRKCFPFSKGTETVCVLVSISGIKTKFSVGCNFPFIVLFHVPPVSCFCFYLEIFFAERADNYFGKLYEPLLIFGWIFGDVSLFLCEMFLTTWLPEKRYRRSIFMAVRWLKSRCRRKLSSYEIQLFEV